jgi:hypothetical protein
MCPSCFFDTIVRKGMWRNCSVGLSRIEWARGGIGIRVRLRSAFRKDWEFESPRAHSIQDGVRLRSAFRKDWQ